MARLVTKFKYLKPDQEKPIDGYATYIATREGVEKIDESFKLAPATVKHQKLIEKILRDFPDSAAMLEYEDYQREKTVGAASEFITRAIEDNAHEILNQKTYGLGKLYLSRDFSGRDVKKAIDYLMAAAGKGHDYAMYTLGKLFLEGKEIPKNPEYALRWLEEAVEKENPYAEYLLGKTLLQGVDLPQDIPRAVSLLEKAAARSNPYAAYALGKALLEGTVLLQNLPRAMELLTFSADQGFSAAQYLLGKVFSNGELLPKDIPKAILYLTIAAEQDHEYAQYLLGKLYLAGEGIPKDAKAALHWFTKAADQGNAFAQYQLGNWQEHSYVALCSTATYGDTHILKMNPQIDTVVTCLDHDSAGIEGNYRLKKHT